MTDIQTITLAGTDITTPALGLGTWQWGDLFWAYGRGYNRNDCAEAFEVALDAGITLFDTAEIYGFGTSEKLLGSFATSTDRPVVIASKYFPYPWRLGRGQFHAALNKTLKRLGVEQIALYQIHWPRGWVAIPRLMQSMAEAVQQGKIKAVGVSNYNAEQMETARQALAGYGIPLASNQVPYHLLDLRYARNGTLAACQQHNITLIAYSPLAQGLLTGKYHQEADLRPTGLRQRSKAFKPENLQRTRPLIELLTQLAEKYEKTAAQVALNWLLCQPNVLAIPGAKNGRQAANNAGALGWLLTAEDHKALSDLSKKVAA